MQGTMSSTGEFRVQLPSYRRSLPEEEVRQGQITPVPVTPPPSYRSYYSDDEDIQGQITPATDSPPPSYRSSYSDDADSQGQRTPATLSPTPSYRSTISEEEVRQGQRTPVKPPPSYRSAVSDEKDSQGQRTPDPATPITKGLHCKAGRKNNCIVTANSTLTLENIPERLVIEQSGIKNTHPAPKRRRKCQVRFSCRTCVIVSLFIYWLGSTIAPILTTANIFIDLQTNETDTPQVSSGYIGSARFLFNYVWLWVAPFVMSSSRCDGCEEDCGGVCVCMGIIAFYAGLAAFVTIILQKSLEARCILVAFDIILSFALALFLFRAVRKNAKPKL